MSPPLWFYHRTPAPAFGSLGPQTLLMGWPVLPEALELGQENLQLKYCTPVYQHTIISVHAAQSITHVHHSFKWLIDISVRKDNVALCSVLVWPFQR